MSNPDHAGPYMKPLPRAIQKAQEPTRKVRKRLSPLKRERAAADRNGSDEVRARSKGQCEVLCVSMRQPSEGTWCRGPIEYRCVRNATQVHHMIGGSGRRGIGASAFAEHKQHVCDQCHLGITGDVGGRKLHRVGGVVPRWTDYYRRVRD